MKIPRVDYYDHPPGGLIIIIIQPEKRLVPSTHKGDQGPPFFVADGKMTFPRQQASLSPHGVHAFEKDHSNNYGDVRQAHFREKILPVDLEVTGAAQFWKPKVPELEEEDSSGQQFHHSTKHVNTLQRTPAQNHAAVT